MWFKVRVGLFVTLNEDVLIEKWSIRAPVPPHCGCSIGTEIDECRKISHLEPRVSATCPEFDPSPH